MSDEKELNRRKEVDDLISKYARKKAPIPHPVGPPPALGQNSAHHPGGPIPLQKDYSSWRTLVSKDTLKIFELCE